MRLIAPSGAREHATLIAETIESRERKASARMVVIPIKEARERLKARLAEDGLLLSA